MTPPISLCTDIRLDDLQRIIDLHGSAYAKECGWNASFKAYVAGPLIDWFKNASPRNRSPHFVRGLSQFTKPLARPFDPQYDV